jgi:hypothetical protein
MKRTAMFLLGLTVLLAGCRDLGLPGNVPAEEARTAPPPELVAQVMAPAEQEHLRLVVDGRLWMPQGMPVTHIAGELRPVGATAGQTVYARAWDERPYRAIFTRVEMPPAEEAMTARAAMEAGLDHWQQYSPVIGRRGRATAPARVRPAPAGLEGDSEAEVELEPGELGPADVEPGPATRDGEPDPRPDPEPARGPAPGPATDQNRSS